MWVLVVVVSVFDVFVVVWVGFLVCGFLGFVGWCNIGFAWFEWCLVTRLVLV